MTDPDGLVNYLYVLSMAHARLKEYPQAFLYLSKYALDSPICDPMLQWKVSFRHWKNGNFAPQLMVAVVLEIP